MAVEGECGREVGVWVAAGVFSILWIYVRICKSKTARETIQAYKTTKLDINSSVNEE